MISLLTKPQMQIIAISNTSPISIQDYIINNI